MWYEYGNALHIIERGVQIIRCILSNLVELSPIFLVILGVIAINEMHLRGLDAVCGFYARLKANLQTLEKCSYKGDFNKFEETKSIFAYIIGCDKSIFIDDDMVRFRESASRTITLFESSNGQVPLNKEMYKDIGDLILILNDIIFALAQNIKYTAHYQQPGENILQSNNILDEHKYFMDIIGNITSDIDRCSEKMFGGFRGLWKKYKRPTKK